MKKLVLGIFVMVAGVSIAQDEKANWGSDSLKCRQNVALYTDFLTKKEFKGATRFWQEAVAVCPQYKSNLYANGAYIYGKLADGEQDATAKKRYVDSIFFSYDKLIEYFGATPEAKQDYGIALMKYDEKNSHERANKLLSESIDEAPADVSATGLQMYTKSNMMLYKAKKFDDNRMVEEYFKSINASQLAYKKTGNANFPKVDDYLNTVYAPFLSCEQLVPFNQKKFDANPDDVDNLQKILASLQKGKCLDGELFGKVTEKLLTLSPSAEGHYNYAILMEKKNKDGEAMSNIAKALELCGSCEDREKYVAMAARIAANAGRGQQAVSYANEWLSINSGAGEAYLIMARAFASSASSCATNEVEKGLVFALAIDYANKARNTDSSVAGTANSYIASWTGQLPTKENLFFAGLEAGSSYTIGCWINKSTTVRTKD
jgi:tetratricopeptide (TPR) repeat protein